MKIKLSITERMKVNELIQDQTGSNSTLKLIRLAMEELSFSEQEAKDMELKQVPTGDGKTSMYWSPKYVDPMKECDIGEYATSLIVKKLKSLNDAEMLHQEQNSIYDKFIETPAK